MSASEARTKLQAKIQTMDTGLITAAVRMIGGGMVSVEEQMVRAYLIEEYENRNGEDAADALMDSIGL